MNEYLFDLGNTRLKFAPLQADGSLGAMIAIDHDGANFAPGWESMLPAHIDAASIASVATAALRVQLLDALTRRCGRISIVRTESSLDGLRIDYAQPQRMGVDRFLALLAAHARGEGACLIAGVGTALTLDLLDADGQHRGGRIAPSPALMRAALHARAAQLPESGGRYTDFADNTEDALASGCEGAALALIVESIRAGRAMLGAEPKLLLHGGGAELLLPRLTGAVYAPGLVLEGLARWARMGTRPA